MLTQVCKELNNYFEKCIYTGQYTITNGEIDLSDIVEEGDLQTGQYFRIAGSVFNDGVYEYPPSQLKDETFVGAIWCMAVPQEVVNIANSISAWLSTYKEQLDSPYQSESFGGYSYSKGGYGSGSSGGGPSWQSQFRSQLNMWRKI